MIFNKIFGFVKKEYVSALNLLNADEIKLNDKIFLKLVYNIETLDDLYKFVSVDSSNNNTIERVLNKFYNVNLTNGVIKNNIDKYIDILLIYLKRIDDTLIYSQIFKCLKIEIKKKNANHIYNIKKNLDLLYK